MAYQALYRKYRPTLFSEVVGQQHITETLKAELKDGKVSHAYLFTGSRGTGKTSCAKILSKAVNCLNLTDGEPCGVCEACKAIASGVNSDVVEIDAASNNGVDDIRRLREQVNFIPANSKCRVYIIDEVHMLTDQAFNALLKTLEEPPGHIVFILATTEVHKLPATILSRCQRFDFRRIDNDGITKRLESIAQNEGIKITKEAASLIAATADGGMRDALSLLDICVSVSREIDETTVISACGMAGNEHLFSLSDLISKRDTEQALLLLDKLYASSVDMLRLINDLIGHYRNLMILKTVKGNNPPIVCSIDTLNSLRAQADGLALKDIIHTLNILNATLPQMQNGNRRLIAEMTVIKLCVEQPADDISDLIKRVEALEKGTPTIKNSFVPPIPQKPAQEISPSATALTEEKADLVDDNPLPPEPMPAIPTTVGDGPLAVWGEIVTGLQVSCPPSIGILAGSKAYIKGDLLLIDSPNPMFGEMMNKNEAIRTAIKKAVTLKLGRSYRLGPYKKAAQAESDPLAALAEALKNLELNGEN